MVFQNPDNQLVSSSCIREIAFGPENIGLVRDEIKHRVDKIVEYLGLNEILDSPPTELSGGQKQKVAIASALALEPKILVFDEPSSNLDPLSTQNLIKIINNINDELKTTIVIVEHKLEYFLNIATHIICIKDGEIELFGKTNEVVENEKFYDIGIQIPPFLRLFYGLKKIKAYDGRLPLFSAEGIKILKNLI